MLGALVLAVFVSIGLILFGAGLMLLAFFAESMSPIPGQAHAGGIGIFGAILLVAGAALLALTLWPDAADASPAIHFVRAALV